MDQPYNKDHLPGLQVRREIAWIMAAFLLLCVISAYRQYSIRFWPQDPLRPVAVYLVYLLLMAGWWCTISNRVTQRNMRVFLLAEHAVILLGLTIRFVQDALLYHDTYLMRLSGYWEVIPIALFALFGFYAALGLGQAEEYRLDRRWFLLMLPAGLLILLMLTNERHHLVFRLLEGEVQPNLIFHPNLGLYAIIVWVFILLIARVFLIWRRSRETANTAGIINVPFLIAILMLLFTILYQASSFAVSYELIEFAALMFFLEVLLWESCIMSGMVPVNTRYEEVFDRSTVAMQIITEDGESYLRSAAAPSLPPETLDLLKRQTTVHTAAGQELHLHRIRGGYSIWLSDVSRTLAVIRELRQSAAKLQQEGELLRQELKQRSDEASVKEQNRIYTQLTGEIGGQLSRLRALLQDQDAVEDQARLFRIICQIGTYIKRRCNLRLVEQSDGIVSRKELGLCYLEMAGILQQMGVAAEVLWSATELVSPEFALFSVDLWQGVLEYEDFQLRSIKIEFTADSAFSITVFPGGANAGAIPKDELQRLNRANFGLRWRLLDGGYQVACWQREGCAC